MKFSGLLAFTALVFSAAPMAQAKTAAECRQMAVNLNAEKQAYMADHAELKTLQEEAELAGIEYDDAKQTSTWSDGHKAKSDAMQAKFEALKEDVNTKSEELVAIQAQLNRQITLFNQACSTYLSQD
ncbi:MAG: hypothetical protein CMK09_12600 [Ponticaulis sp.]|nr:hypothetical protein [Ponticaulis sp.]|tara:strand:- start:2174 stop:2554 length:381 start_codon:yes stop_codon:yes gene_type:complete